MYQQWLPVAAILASLAYAAEIVKAVSTITATGSKLFDSTGNQFFIQGVAYQPPGSDPLANSSQCALDVLLMARLGVNTVRVYTVDHTQNHDNCMATFGDSGIYVLIDLSTSSYYLDRTAPQWTSAIYSQFTATLDAFALYDNLLGVIVGNEVVNDFSTASAAPYIKAAARDVKAYRDSKGYRKIPVGYTGVNLQSIAPYLQNYLACGSKASDAIDFFGLNLFSWCSSSQTFKTSGYEALTANATNYNIPIFIAETGCNAAGPRTFDDQAAIYGSQMTAVWSGAIIYEWVQEINNYGLVQYPQADIISTISPDYNNLKSQWATNIPSGTPSSSYSPSNTPPDCPASTSGGWPVVADALLPTISGLTFTTPSSIATRPESKTGGSVSTTNSNTGSATTSASGPSSPSVITLSSPSGGLPTGGKVAIGVVITLLVTALLLLGLWLFHYRRKQKRGAISAKESSTSPGDDHDKPEMEAGIVPSRWGPVMPKAELNAATLSRQSPTSHELHHDHITETGNPEMDSQIPQLGFKPETAEPLVAEQLSHRYELATSPLAGSRSLAIPETDTENVAQLQELHKINPDQVSQRGSSQASRAPDGPGTSNKPPDHESSSQYQNSEPPWQHDFTYPINSTTASDTPDHADAAVAELSAISVKRKALAKAAHAAESPSQEPTPEKKDKDAEIARLMGEQERINEERARIKELQELDRKEAYIRERLESLK